MSAWACESAHHVGDRLISSPSDRFELRLEARRLTDQGRERVRLLEHVCRACLSRWFEADVCDIQEAFFA